MKGDPGPRPAVLFWVQHLLGSGHLHRIAAIAAALAARGVRVTIASGGLPPAVLETGGATLVQLEPVRAADAGFSALVDGDGRPAGAALFARRRQRLEALVAELNPAAVVTETFPFGRRLLAGEALALLAAARAEGRRPAIVSSVRDILQRPRRPQRLQEMLATALAHYHRVMVHGDPAIADFAASFPPAARLGRRLCHSGYVARPGPIGETEAQGPGGGEVVVSAGSGTVGGKLLAAARRARSFSRRAGDRRWRLLAGEPARAAAIAPAAGVIVEANRTDFRRLLANCAVSVSQGGYNTVIDLYLARARAVVVPYAGGGESEQAERAARLTAVGGPLPLSEAELAPETLAAAVDRAFERPRLDAAALDLGGAERSARLLCRWIGHGRLA